MQNNQNLRKLLNICFALWAVCVIASILSPLALFAILANNPLDAILGGIVWIVGYALLTIATIVFQYVLLYHAWKMVTVHGVRAQTFEYNLVGISPATVLAVSDDES